MKEKNEGWFYAEKGKQIGPISLVSMEKLIAEKKINRNTSVWDGEGDWKPAHETVLLEIFNKGNTAPPPLAGNDIDNKFVWFVAMVPLIGIIIELIVGQDLLLMYLIFNIGLCVLDERKLKAAGHDAPNTVWAVLIPVYLWKRATLLNQKRHYFTGWIVAFILSTLVALGGQQVMIEESSCQIVTEIIEREYGKNSVSCKVVTIKEEVTTGFYTATATLSNGNSVNITIELREDNMIYVEIVN